MVNFELNLVQLTLYELDLNLDHFLALITDTKHLLRTNTVTNVHVSNKLTIGTSKHSFKSVDKGRKI